MLARAHDCIGLLMGSRHDYQTYFDAHPGAYFRSPGWLSFQTVGQTLEPAHAATQDRIGERRSLDDLIAQYGEDNGRYLYDQFRAFRIHYSGLTYISTGVDSEDEFRNRASAEAEKQGWAFDNIKGSLNLLERLVNGQWDEADFLVVPSGASVRGSLGNSIVEAQ